MYGFPLIYLEARKLISRYLKFLEAEAAGAKIKSAEHEFYLSEIKRVKGVLKELRKARPTSVQAVEKNRQLSWGSDRPHEYHIQHVKAGEWMVKFEPEEK